MIFCVEELAEMDRGVSYLKEKAEETCLRKIKPKPCQVFLGDCDLV